MTTSRNFTEETRAWLEDRFRVKPGELYRAHEPIYGLDEKAGHSEPDQLWRMAKTVQVMRSLARLDVATLLDVGAAEGYTASLARKIFGVRPVISDISAEALKHARDFFSLSGVACNASRLPFADNSFDVVVSTECIEHLEHPYQMILEAVRVARKAVIISTVEGRASHTAAKLRLLLLPEDEPHGHRSCWSRADFVRVFGPGVETSSQHLQRPWTMAPPADLLRQVAVPAPPPHFGEGILACIVLDPSVRKEKPTVDDDRIIAEVLSFNVPLRPSRPPDEQASVPADLLAGMRCPRCLGALVEGSAGLRCASCSSEYRVSGGVPDCFVAEPADLEKLARMPKLGDAVPARARVAWARKRMSQFDRAKRIRSPSIRKTIERLQRLFDFLEAQPGAAGKAAFVFGKFKRIVLRSAHT
ncbi:MAG TPA: methyltransferase domain-containing protein [Kiritimatiellia bacterium]